MKGHLQPSEEMERFPHGLLRKGFKVTSWVVLFGGFGFLTVWAAPKLTPQPVKTASAQLAASPTVEPKALAFPERPFQGKGTATPSPRPSPSPPTRVVKAAAPSQIDVRVLISDQPDIAIASTTTALLTDVNGKALRSLGASEAFPARPTASGVQIGDWQGPTLVWVMPEKSGLVAVNGRWYRGKVALIVQDDKVLAVNQLDVEHYLYSVVGAEMYKHWGDEALKAQAVAARSYALAHIAEPASSYYDLGNTQRWQVYQGVAEETDKTLAAVEATRAQILTQGDGVVVAYYASTDKVVDEAHKGLGMSQSGAQDLASKGYPYSQILSYYYPGTSLVSIALSPSASP